MSSGDVEAAALTGLPRGAAVAPLRPRDPRQLGAYELLGRLGEGGMGKVYLARSATGRRVALKVIREALAEDDEFRRRFRGEVARAAQVPPFCTAEVLDADPDHDPPYLVVEFVDGPSLTDVVERDGPLTPANLHGLAVGMAAALTAIHGAGVIHRDLKPSNVLLAPGSPKVIDFGISRPVDGTMTHSSGNHVVGTVAYMAPERFGADASRTLTPAADIFAWGAVVAYAGTGRSPFPADSIAQVAVRILTDPPELTGLAEPLHGLVGQALFKDPRERPTARQLLDRLTTPGPHTGNEPPVRAPATLREKQLPVGIATPPTTPLRRRRSRAAIATASLAALLGLAATAGVATGIIPLPAAHRGANPAATGEAASASASPTPGPSVPPAFTQILQDSLDKPGNWRLVDDRVNKARCEVDGGRLVTQQAAGTYRCLGPMTLNTPARSDVAVYVDVTLLTPASCAGIWFRFFGGGYLVAVCSDAMHLFIHGLPDAKTMNLRYTPQGSGLTVGQRTRIGILADGGTLRLYRAGKQVGEFTALDLSNAGHVVLGGYVGGLPGEPPYQVRFSNVTVWSDVP